MALVDDLVSLLSESRRGHALTCEYHSHGACTCGADEWNARVVVLLGDASLKPCTCVLCAGEREFKALRVE